MNQRDDVRQRRRRVERASRARRAEAHRERRGASATPPSPSPRLRARSFIAASCDARDDPLAAQPRRGSGVRRARVVRLTRRVLRGARALERAGDACFARRRHLVRADGSGVAGVTAIVSRCRVGCRGRVRHRRVVRSRVRPRSCRLRCDPAAGPASSPGVVPELEDDEHAAPHKPALTAIAKPKEVILTMCESP